MVDGQIDYNMIKECDRWTDRYNMIKECDRWTDRYNNYDKGM